MTSLVGRAVSMFVRTVGNVNPVRIKKKKKDLVKQLRGTEKLFRHYMPPPGYRYQKIDVQGVPVEIFAPKKNGSDKVVLVIHGGSYISHMMFYYRLLNKRYSKASGGGTVIQFDYRCAPEHPYPAALEDALKVWNWLTEQGYRPENIVTAGDSSGGHLTLDLLMRLHDTGGKMPKASVLMSPWIDMTISGSSYAENYPVDVVFGEKGKTPTPEEVRAIMKTSGHYGWFGDRDRSDPMISPVLNEFDGSYPAIFVAVGENEMLRSEAQTLVEKFRQAGLEAELLIGEGMFHAYPMYQFIPESRQTLKRVSTFIGRQLGVN